MFEIEITNTGNKLVLPNDFEVSFELTNPFFQLDDLSGAFSFSFDFPLTAANKKALGHIHRIESENIRDRQYDVTTRFQGVLLYTGILVIDNIINDQQPQCEAHIEAGLTRLGEKLKGLTLADFDWSEIFYDIYSNSNPTKAKNTNLGGVAGVDPNLEIVYKEDFSDTIETELKDSSSIYSEWPKWVYVPIHAKFDEKYDLSQPGEVRRGQWVNHYFYNPNVGVFQDPYVIPLETNQVYHYTAFMQVKYAIETILGQVGYTLKRNLFDYDDLERLMLYSNVHEMAPFAFGYVATVQGVNFDKNITSNKAIELVAGVAKLFSAAIYVNEKQRIVELVPRKEIINAAKTSDITSFASPYYEIDQSQSRITGVRLAYNFQDQLATDSVNEVDDKKLEASVQSYWDLPSNPKIGETRLVKQRQRYYIYDEDDKGNVEWQEHSLNFIPSFLGQQGDVEEIELKDVNPMMEYRGRDEFMVKSYDPLTYYFPNEPSTQDRYWLIPDTKASPSVAVYNNPTNVELVQSSESTIWPKAFNTSPLLVFFYRGFAKDSNGYDYPLGNSGNEDHSGNKTGTYSMRLNTDDGLMEQWWKEYAFFRINSTILHRTLYMSIDELANVYDLFKNKVRIENTNYLIEKLEFTLKPSGVSPVKAKMHTVK